eukprot:TRINITY_DN121078_c0_g1_i1.p1 TRINITY_DN121078_c0_g1~~TRINITY_DN121078_c0_g1_i1.p1  ORF type:complete len:606 (-),score=78.50 TRINITY_DN121078_c0_g1_i1:303-2120(-)
MVDLSELSIIVPVTVIILAHVLHSRLCITDQCKEVVEKARDDVGVWRAILTTFWGWSVCLLESMGWQRHWSKARKHRHSRLQAELQTWRQAKADAVLVYLQRFLAIALSLLVLIASADQLLAETSAVKNLARHEIFVFVLWQGSLTYLLCVLYSLGFLCNSRYLSNVDMWLTVYLVLFGTNTLLWLDGMRERTIILDFAGFIAVSTLYTSFWKVLFVCGLHDGAYVLAGTAMPEGGPIGLLAVAFLSQVLRTIGEAQSETTIRERQRQRTCRALGGFLKGAYDVFFSADEALCVMGPMPELAHFLRVRPSEDNAHGSMDALPFLSFVVDEERESVTRFLSESPEDMTIALSANVSILLSDGVVSRSQLFHRVEDDLDGGLTHWMALRHLEIIEPVGGGGLAIRADGVADQQAQPLDGALECSASEVSSVLSSALTCSTLTCAAVPSQRPSSITFGLDASQEDLAILSFLADFTESTEPASRSSKVSMKDSMPPKEWLEFRQWIAASRSRILDGKSPHTLPLAVFILQFLDIAVLGTNLSLSPIDREASHFALRLEGVVAVPLTQARIKAQGRSETRHGGLTPNILSRVVESSAEQVEAIEHRLAP